MPGYSTVQMEPYMMLQWNDAQQMHLAQQTTVPPFLVFNVDLETCDYDFNVPSPCGTLSASTSASFVCPEPNGYFSNPNSCLLFYICTDGTENIQYCAERLVYNPQKKTCDFPYNIQPLCGTLWTSTEAKTTHTTQQTSEAPILVTETTDSEAPSSETKLVSSTALPFVCPDPDGYFSNPNSCFSLYICIDGTGTIQYCAERLVYNPQKKTCDFPHNVNPPCGTCATYVCILGSTTHKKTSATPDKTTESGSPSRTTGHLPETTTSLVTTDLNSQITFAPSTSSPFVFPKPDGYFSNTEVCYSFYICYEGTENIRYTQKKSAYSATGFTDKTTQASSTSGPFICPEPDGYFSNPDSCYTFYICYEGTENIWYCSEGLFYNPLKRTCDYPYNVAPPCGKSNSSRAGPEDELIGSLPEYQCPDAGGSFPWVSCDKYVQCIDLEASLYQCKYDYFFDLRWEGCNYPELVDCTNRTLPDGSTGAPMTTTARPPTPTFQCPSANGNFRNPYDCSSYYVCSNGITYLVKCPSDLVFNIQTESCDYPSAVDCSQLSTLKISFEERELVTDDITEEPITNPTPVWWFDCSTRNGFFPNPEDCTSYINCDNGNAWLLYCPNGTLYDATVERCTTNAPCTTSDFIRTSPNIQTATPDPNFECPEPNGLFANPLDCHSFYQCANNTPQFQFCPGNLHFSVEEEQCLDPSEANCQLYSFNFIN
ncbi:chitin-binding domain protein cbd-1-like [Artemia franciscana]|uniref:chitin-binding domain protein cbd-1-like n=1 Tax=Artemia franciscana TaxID=6661 RepID=UPI0032DB0DED